MLAESDPAHQAFENKESSFDFALRHRKAWAAGSWCENLNAIARKMQKPDFLTKGGVPTPTGDQCVAKLLEMEATSIS